MTFYNQQCREAFRVAINQYLRDRGFVLTVELWEQITEGYLGKRNTDKIGAIKALRNALKRQIRDYTGWPLVWSKEPQADTFAHFALYCRATRDETIGLREAKEIVELWMHSPEYFMAPKKLEPFKDGSDF